jgi:uncharacterized membrane protein YhaH (DUF805 family)
MTFQESIRTCFAKYADFSGRASRSEYWWFALFITLTWIASSMISDVLGLILSGWWQLISLVPIIGTIVLIVFLAQASKSEDFLVQA